MSYAAQMHVFRATISAVCICIALVAVPSPVVSCTEKPLAEKPVPVDKPVPAEISAVKSAWEATQAEHAEGQMQFKIVQEMTKETHTYTGIVGWQFPNIRWEFEQSVQTATSSSQTRVILIDTPKEIISYSPDTRHAYRSWDRCRSYTSVLRLAPWQCWFEYDGQVPFSDVLNADKLRADEDCIPTASRRGDNVHINFSRSVVDFDMVFDSRSGAILRYSGKPKNDFPGVLKSGDFEWIWVDGAPFPQKISFSEWEPRKDLHPKPRLTIETSNHQRSLKQWKSTDFSYASLDKGKIDEMVEYFRDNRPPVIHKYRRKFENNDETLRELGEAIAKMGFALGGN